MLCDDGVYAITNEIQLLRSDLCASIFIDLGKIVLSCLWKYLSVNDMNLTVLETGVFATGVVEIAVINEREERNVIDF